MDTIILIAAGLSIGIFSFLTGFFFASALDFQLRISKKEDYEEKTRVFESLIADLESKLTEAEIEPEITPIPKRAYNPNDLFPPDLSKDYGVPRELE
jgi:hypothetical protein